VIRMIVLQEMAPKLQR